MVRTGFRVNRCAGMVLVALCVSVVTALAGDPDLQKRNQLALHAALEKGLDHLQRGHFQEAVESLEKQIALIDGNRRYLTALRDAYRGYIRQLQQAGQLTEAKRYQDFLAVLEPSTRSAPPAPAPKSEPVVKTEEMPPADKGPRNGITGRGKVEQDDPFDDANRAVVRRGRGLVEQAEQEFAARHFANACQLYARANVLEPGAVSHCNDRWAYCRMFTVAETLNRSPEDVAQMDDLEREVREALQLAPRLASFAGKLLQQIKDARSAGTAVEVKHTPRQGSGWALAETANFRIFHAQSQEGAEKAAHIAESTRLAMTRKWFGEPGPAWSPKCDIYLHPTANGYMRSPGGPPAASPGHSTISLDAGRVVSRRVDVRCDAANVFTGVLPHETTHVVLAGRFGRHHVPRWADEGVAVLSEPRDRIDLHLRNLPRHRGDGTLFEVGQLMRMADYPESRLIGPFYAQSVSLVEFLSKKKGAATFTRFLREGLDGRYEVALERHYGYRDFAELDREWRQYAFGENSVANVAEKQP